MLSRYTQKIKTIKSEDAFEFDTKLNAFCDELAKQGIQYEVQTNPTAGLLAFVSYKVYMQTPETVKDEYELVGEWHTCIECPFYVRPTDGRRKYTRCPKNGGLAHRDKTCCDLFYELMDRGEIKLIEVG